MNLNELKIKIQNGALSAFGNLYPDTEAQKSRYLAAIDSFAERYGNERDVQIFSVSGRSEIMGNHTDHNNGCVLAGAIDRDMIAVVSKNDDGVIRFLSEGYPEDRIVISETADKSAYKPYSSASLIAGMVNGFVKEGYAVGGYDAYATSDVLKGSGISSSAAYEVMIGNILNYLYSDGKVDNVTVAKLAQYAENVYFGKPCGLMDQMACAVGGFVYIDFEKNGEPVVEPISFSLTEMGYSLCIVNTGGNHADLNADYASVPEEMKLVAKLLGRETLRGLSEADIVKNIPNLRRVAGDRAILRSLHFMRENKRVKAGRDMLKNSDVEGFLQLVKESGRSSFEYLQNVYTTINVKEQGLSMALALADGFLENKPSAFRVHGGGFAGTVQVFIKNEGVAEFVDYMDGVFGKGATMPLRIRPVGATRIFE